MKIVLITFISALIAFSFPKKTAIISETNQLLTQSLADSKLLDNSFTPKVLKLNNATIKGATTDGFNLTFVTSTGLAWLDATISNEHTTKEIMARMADPSDDLNGFRYATEEEIEALLESYGLPSNGEVTGAGPALSFMKDFGEMGPDYNTMDGPSISPVWPVEKDLNQYKQIIAQIENKKSSVGQGGIDPSVKEAHFLVFDRTFIPHNVSSITASTSSENNMTFDSRTGYSWLDVTNTLNQSINEILKRTQDSNDELYGLRHATFDEIEEMLIGYGIPLNGEISGSLPASSFIRDMGKPSSIYQGSSSGGIFYVNAELGQTLQVIAHTRDKNQEKSSSSSSGIYPDDRISYRGHFLIKTR